MSPVVANLERKGREAVMYYWRFFSVYPFFVLNEFCIHYYYDTFTLLERSCLLSLKNFYLTRRDQALYIFLPPTA